MSKYIPVARVASASFLATALLGMTACKPSKSSKRTTDEGGHAIEDLVSGITARFLAGGDSRDDHNHVLPWAFEEAQARGAKAFFFLGDMELTPELDAHFRRELDLLGPIPLFPAIGNHEVQQFGIFRMHFANGLIGPEKRFQAHFLGTPRTPVLSVMQDRVVYSVNLDAGVHFVALDNVSQPGFGEAHLGLGLAMLALGDPSAGEELRTARTLDDLSGKSSDKSNDKKEKPQP